jgi:hypothetical protein
MSHSFYRRAAGICFLCVILPCLNSRAGFFYSGQSPSSTSWQSGTIPYDFDTNISAADQQVYLDGVEEWALACNIHFVQHTTETNWIHFAYDPVTFLDHVDSSDVPWVVTISVLSRAQACHEMGHALGFNHENIRPDSTNYITVLTNNIVDLPANIVWFTVDPTGVTNGNYDFESVMHLGNNFASIDPANLYTQLARPGYEKYQPRMGNLALSRGDRAAAAFLHGAGPTLTNVVTTTADGGTNSLRAALYYAEDHPGTTVRFNIPNTDPGFSNGVYTIKITGFLPPLVVDNTTIDGTTQPGYAGRLLIVLDGTAIIPDAYPPGQVTGLLIYAAHCQVKGMSFQNFGWNGLTLEYPYATNNQISQCWAGLDYTGTNPAPNAYQGILVCAGASGNIIGPSNVLSGNSEYGFFLTDSNTTGNVVEGNYVGTDPSGTLSVMNDVGGGIVTSNAEANVIGGTNTAAGNVISGNFNVGLWIITANNLIQGNYIGLNSAGTAALPNTFSGMYVIGGAQSNLITGNVLSGNVSDGVRMSDPGTIGNIVSGNFIGTGPGGTNAIPNEFAGATIYNGATGNTIGGTTTAARNVISGNYGYGVVVGNPGSSSNVVEGNYIGTDFTGTQAMPNGSGVLISDGAQDNILGGVTAGARNVIDGSYGYGVLVANPGTSGNVIEGNYIGTDFTGTNAVPNWSGVLIDDNAATNILGGLSAGARNVIAGSYYIGVWMTNTTGNLLEGNYIGLAADGVTALGNGGQGILVQSLASTNVIGLSVTGSGAGNVIAYNGVYDSDEGILLEDTNTAGDTIRGNAIYSNYGPGIELNPGQPGDQQPNHLQNYPVITNAVTAGGNTVIKGTLNSGTNRTYLVDVYWSAGADLSGHVEGQVYLGGTSVTTDGTGKAGFTFTAAGDLAGQYITTTATDAQTGDTSEFSLAMLAINGPTAPSFAVPVKLTATGFVATVSLTIGQPYHIQATTNFLTWVNLTNFTASNTNFVLVDKGSTNLPYRFYRIISP